MASVNVKDLPPKYRKQIKSKLKTQAPQKGMAERISDAILEEELQKKKRKYRAKPVTIDGHRFPSTLEGNYYCELRLREKAGEISNLVLQPRFLLQESFEVNGKKYARIEYIADFMYEEAGRTKVVDTKGFVTDTYAIKRKLFLYRYGKDYDFIEKRLEG